MTQNIRENSFDAAPGGSAGALNYQTPVGTHSSPSNYQDPSGFATKFYDPHTTGQPGNELTDKSGSFDKDVNTLFKNKEKPTVDDVLCGIQYELQHMLKKDKRVAKELVIANMKKHGPKYYSKLHMMNISDKDIDNDIQERINILDKMIAEKKERRKDIGINDAIRDILNQKREEKFARSNYLLDNSIQ